MKYIKQWSSPVTKPLDLTIKGKGLTVPGQVMDVKTIVKRVASGNLLGVNFMPVSFHSDDPDFDDEQDMPVIDPSDPLNSMWEHSKNADFIRNEIKKKTEAARKEAKKKSEANAE